VSFNTIMEPNRLMRTL